VLLTKRKVRLYSGHVRVIYASCFAQPPFTLCALRRQQVPSRRTRPQNFPMRGDLKALGHGFARFAAGNGLRHKCEKYKCRRGDNKFFHDDPSRPAKASNPKKQAPDKPQPPTPLRPLGVMLSGAKHL